VSKFTSTLVPIGECVEAIRTWNPALESDDDTFHYIDISSVSQDEKRIIQKERMPTANAPSRARQLVKTGDVLVSTVRPNLNVVAVLPMEMDGATASTGFCILRPNPSLLCGRFLFHWVQSSDFVGNMVKRATGQSYPAVSDKIVKQSQLPLPPLDEQRRIAEILDQADALRRKRQRAIDRLNELGQSVFLEMFGDQFAEGNCQSLGLHAKKIGSGATPKGGGAAYKSEGISLIRSMNVRNGTFSRRGLAHISDEQARKLNNVIVEENDVLLNITGASVARVCIVPSDVLPARVNQHVSIIRLGDTILPEFLEAFLLLPKTKRKLLTIAESGATRQAITKQEIEELRIPIFSIESQRAYAVRRNIAAVVSRRLAHQVEVLEHLFFSLQHRAFTGQL